MISNNANASHVDSAQLSFLTTEDVEPSPVLTALAEIDPDKLTPRQALDWIYRLKDMDN